MTAIIIAGFVIVGIVAYLLVRGGSDGPEIESSEYEADWTGSADPVSRWGNHAAAGYPAFSDDEGQAKVVETKLGALRKGDRA